MPAIKTGALEAHEKLTARLFIQPHGIVGYTDIGNVADYKQADTREYRTRMAAEAGFRYVNDEQPDSIHQMFEFTLDEHSAYNERLLLLAAAPSAITQSAATAATAQFTNVVQGASYFLAARPVSNVVVTVSAVTKTLGTDYTVDLNTGRITIVEGGTIAEASTVDVTYDTVLRNYESFTARSQPLFRGAARIEEFNQLSSEPLRVITGNANITITAFPEQTGEFGRYTCRLTFTSQPTIVKRHVA